jgi:hypothetical protein
MAICIFCNVDQATETIECNVSNCDETCTCCTSCFHTFICAVCEFSFCKTHSGDCAKCGKFTCAYCARKLPEDPSLLCLNCFDQVTSHLVAEEVIASCPLASTLPEPDYSIFTAFDPPIELLTYSQSKAAARKGTRPQDVQAEHFVPNSCFIVGKGRSGLIVHGAGLYSEGKALTYWVDDDQKADTEHKFLTDRERAFCEECETKKQFPTLEQWLKFMQASTFESIMMFRTYVGDTTGLNPQEIDNAIVDAANKAAFAVRYRMEEHFTDVLKANLSARLGNGIVGGLAPPKKVKKAQEYDL